MTVEEALEIVEKLLDYDSLNKIQEIVFRQAWEEKSYSEIAASTSYDPEYIKQVGFHLWQSLSKALSKKVTKNNFQSILKQYARQTQTSTSFSAISSTRDLAKSDRNYKIGESIDITALNNAILPKNLSTDVFEPQDWGDALDVSVFYGRTAELLELEQWIVQERCRLVTILGMGGIGKTALCVKLAERIQEHFKYIIWRSLRNAPPVEEILTTLLKFLSHEQETNLPESLDGKILHLLGCLRSSRCLLILDNVESILQSGNAGQYRTGYEGYGQLLRCVGETRHQSCLVLTSREKPKGLAVKEGARLPLRSLQISGLSLAAGKEIFQAKGFFSASSEDEWRVLIEHYAGNPLALKMVATVIQDFFDGNISKFLELLEQSTLVFDDICNLLEQQFNRLSKLEKDIMYWLAINRVPVSFPQLQADWSGKVGESKILEALASLQGRSLIEKTSTGFCQQPVVMEYVTERIIEQAGEEIINVNSQN